MTRHILVAVLTVAFALPMLAAEPAPKPKVKLAVLVVFDQMRGDFIDKWQPYFGPDGFRRLQTQGAWFTDCHYPYGTTSTGPGHASMLTGATPRQHGIINNEWYDRAAAKDAYCAGVERYKLVIDNKLVAGGKNGAGAPDRCLSPTVADQLKAATQGQGKVFGVSLKDRSGILPSGQKPDGVFWFNGQFISSTYYNDTLPEWVQEFNTSDKPKAYFKKAWTKFKPDLDYAKLAGPDDGAGEGTGSGQGVTFPHPMDGGKDGLKGYFSALANSPFGNNLLLEFAKTCIISEKLGQDDVPDLLTISFSSNDLVGHTWGPDSQEVLDTTLRSDAVMAELLKFLDDTVGAGHYAMAVTADHGICPLPEFAAKQGKDAKRVSALGLIKAAEDFLQKTYGQGENANNSRWIEAIPAPYVYLNHRLIESKKLDKSEVSKTLAKFLKTQDGIGNVWTYEELNVATGPADKIAKRVWNAFHPDRSGDLYLMLKPYYLVGAITVGSKIATGTNHGSPYDYDTYVPLLAFGPGITGGKRSEAVAPQHAATILADFLGVTKPKDCQYDLPKTLWKE